MQRAAGPARRAAAAAVLLAVCTGMAAGAQAVPRPAAAGQWTPRAETPAGSCAGGRCPSYMVIGASKCGSTSMYHYLAAHPEISTVPPRCCESEHHFFDTGFVDDLEAYLETFPAQRGGRRRIFGEVTPHYLYVPQVPRRIRNLMPNWRELKFIVLLRDPAERAISQYLDKVRDNQESQPLHEVVARQLYDRLAAEACQAAADGDWIDSYACFPSVRRAHALYFSYLDKSIYVDQLVRWFSIFDRSQFLVLDLADLAARPQQTMDTVFGFLGLRPHQIDSFRRFNERDTTDKARKERLRRVADAQKESLRKTGLRNRYGYRTLDEQRAMLRLFFRPHNLELEALLGRSFNWTAAAA